jgi:formyltetrahydrofolate deformylase
MKRERDSAVLLVKCPERKGVIAAVAGFIAQHGGDILNSEQHSDREHNLFMMRSQWSLDGFGLPMDGFAKPFESVAREFEMDWRLDRMQRRARVAIFVSKSGHCLADLLYRQQIGELNCEIPLIVSNHEEQRRLAEFYEIPYVVVPVTAETRVQAEQQHFRLLGEHKIELIVLARYMQILSNDFIRRYPNQIINIHHSFLPAFIGAKPYHRSYERGVKLIGATSHYVTEILDEGPIIEQDTVRISHKDSLDDMVRKGGDIEKIVLSRAVRAHLEHKVMVYGNKTVVFG